MSNSFTFAMWNLCATVCGCFLMTHLAIFSLNFSDENKSIMSLCAHCSAVVP